jgi:2-phosphosulfolactate phosphatase
MKYLDATIRFAIGTLYTLTMQLSTLILPRDIQPESIASQSVVVFDVLRATTSMTAALSAGVKEIRVFDSLDAAKTAADAFGQPRLLCGERNTLPPPGFDLGNSPGQFDATKHAGMTVFMSTTNGTRAIVAAQNAAVLFTGALVNTSAVARQLRDEARNVTLVCSGSDGQPSMEDLLGCGAVITDLSKLMQIDLANDLSRIAVRLFDDCKENLPAVLADTYGGHNIRRVHLEADIAFAARLDVFNTVGKILREPLRVIPA